MAWKFAYNRPLFFWKNESICSGVSVNLIGNSKRGRGHYKLVSLLIALQTKAWRYSCELYNRIQRGNMSLFTENIIIPRWFELIWNWCQKCQILLRTEIVRNFFVCLFLVMFRMNSGCLWLLIAPQPLVSPHLQRSECMWPSLAVMST